MNFSQKVLNDFRFMENVGVKEIDGKKYLTVNGDIINASAMMSKTQFIHNWLLQFTLGWVGEKSYFDFEGWYEVSNDGRSTVIIHSDDNPNELLFVIPAFIDMGLNGPETKALAEASAYLSHAYSATEATRATEILETGSNYVQRILGTKPRFIHELVPNYIYEELDIVPEVNRQMIFCKDRYKIEPATPAWKYAEHCFRLIHKGEGLNKEQREFIDTLTQKEFVYPDTLKPYTEKELEPFNMADKLDEC